MKLFHMGGHDTGEIWINGLVNCVWSNDGNRTALIFCIPWVGEHYRLESGRHDFGVWGYCFGLFRDETDAIPSAIPAASRFLIKPIWLWDILIADQCSREIDKGIKYMLMRKK